MSSTASPNPPREDLEAAREIQAAVRVGLREVADPEKAAPMQAYMKSEMPFLGVQSPPCRKALKKVWAAHPIPSKELWIRTILLLWREAEYREERYAAINLSSVQKYSGELTPADLPCFEEMIVTGAWWDYVDSINSRVIGPLLRGFPDRMQNTLLEWADDANMWKRRVAIISQLDHKETTDWAFLRRCMEPSIDSKEFFLRKAIGWALREYAKTAPERVIEYVTANRDRLSGLSKREALRNLIKQGLISGVP